MMPGSVQTCSPEYKAANQVAEVMTIVVAVATGVGIGAVIVTKMLKEAGKTVFKKVGKNLFNKAERQLVKEWKHIESLPHTPKGKRWKPGDNVYSGFDSNHNVTRKEFNKVRERHWKNEAFSPTRDWSPIQKATMKKGRAPMRDNKNTNIGTVKERMELSHEPISLKDGGRQFAMRWPGDHARIDPKRHFSYITKNYGTGKTN